MIAKQKELLLMGPGCGTAIINGIGLGFAGLLIYITLNTLTKAPLEAQNHPFLDESKHLHT